MDRYRRLAVPVIAALLVFALGLVPAGLQAQEEEGDSPLSAESLANLTYLNAYGEDGMVTLVDGEYAEDDADAPKGPFLVTLSGYVAYGDLNGDEAEDAAAVLVTESEGTLTLIDLAVVTEEEGELVNVATVSLGDRVDVTQLDIEDGQIVVDLYTFGDDDPNCCPSLYVQQVYALEDRELVLVSEEELEIAEGEGGFAPDADPTVAVLHMGLEEQYWLDPMLVSVHSGAMSGPGIDASTLGRGCAGTIDERPEVVLEWTENEDVSELRIFLLSLGDPTLVVVTPDGSILCNDDLNPLVLDPMILLTNPASGRYAIYAGSFDANANAPGFLVVTTQDLTPATMDLAQMFPRHVSADAVGQALSVDVLELEGEPVVAGPEEALTVEETPFTQELVAGGILGAYEIELDNELCTGFIDATPTFGFDWEGEAEKLVLFFEADADTTLLVRDPNGAFQCSDDADGARNLNPYLDLTPMEGTYSLWVGSFVPSAQVTGTLTIAASTELQPAVLTTEMLGE